MLEAMIVSRGCNERSLRLQDYQLQMLLIIAARTSQEST